MRVFRRPIILAGLTAAALLTPPAAAIAQQPCRLVIFCPKPAPAPAPVPVPPPAAATGPQAPPAPGGRLLPPSVPPGHDVSRANPPAEPLPLARLRHVTGGAGADALHGRAGGDLMKGLGG